MKKILLLVVLFFPLFCLNKCALASGDDGCGARLKLLHHDYVGCFNMAFLSPSNDTRVNLLLLMADLRRAGSSSALPAGTLKQGEPLFLWDQLADRFELQRGRSEASKGPTPATADEFSVAVRADPALNSMEREGLLSARTKALHGSEADEAAAIASTEKTVVTTSAKAYARYLEGAAEFWGEDYGRAATIFSSLEEAPSAWVREAATYMVGRCLIKRAQIGAFDEYGSIKEGWRADSEIVSQTETALDRYLQKYSKGRYALSARGLKRRGYWLSQDTVKLGEEYGALLLLSPQERNVSDVELAEEIDNKLLEPSKADLLKYTQSPLLLAVFDLKAMRISDGSQGRQQPDDVLSLAALQKQKSYFSTQMPLYEYLLAVHALYVENKAVDVLHLIPDAARQSSFGYVQFSRQMLRGMALEAQKDPHALGFWMQMLPGAKAAYQHPVLELAIAYHEERAGQVQDVFALASPVHDLYMRELLLANVAGADLLRGQAKNINAPAHERDIALFTLLYKEATHGPASEFLKDLALVPPKAPADGYYALAHTGDSDSTPEDHSPTPVPLGIFLHNKTDADFVCPTLRATEQQLAQDADNPTARLCVADFVRLNQPATYLGVGLPPADELGGTPSLFPGGTFARMDVYTAVLANPKASRNDQAYALFRAVNCYAPSGGNDCGGKDVPKAQRKAWFTRLKHDYAGTRWANALQYYW